MSSFIDFLGNVPNGESQGGYTRFLCYSLETGFMAVDSWLATIDKEVLGTATIQPEVLGTYRKRCRAAESEGATVEL